MHGFIAIARSSVDRGRDLFHWRSLHRFTLCLLLLLLLLLATAGQPLAERVGRHAKRRHHHPLQFSRDVGHATVDTIDLCQCQHSSRALPLHSPCPAPRSARRSE